MRHSRVATTTDIYMQEIAEGVRATVDSIHDELHGTMAKLAGGQGAAGGCHRICGDRELMGRNLERKITEAWCFREGDGDD